MANLIQFKSVEVVPLSKSPAKVLIRWQIQPTRENLSDYQFTIERGDAPDQIPNFQDVDINGFSIKGKLPEGSNAVNMAPICQPISALDFYEYVDCSGHLKNLFKQYYYRVRAVKISTQEDVASKIVTWEGDLDLTGLYVVDEHNFLLEDVIGVPCFVYPHKQSGVPCTKCFDPVLKKTLYSNCKTCFGTGWVGGFYNPIDLFLDLSPVVNQSLIMEWGETQDTESDVLLANYPIMNPRDVIREIRENRLWRVVRQRQTEKRRVPMLQFVRIKQITPNDVEYHLPYDEELALDKVRQLESVKKLREF